MNRNTSALAVLVVDEENTPQFTFGILFCLLEWAECAMVGASSRRNISCSTALH